MRRFYIQNYIPGENFQELASDEAYHAAKVLRLESGETVEGFDGKGILFEGKLVVESVSSKNYNVKISVEKVTSTPTEKRNLEIVISAIKLDRLEWMLEKCTEIGIDSIIITHTQYSQVPLSLIQKKMERLNTIVMNACKQSRNLYLTKISVQEFKFLEINSTESKLKLIATTELPSKQLRLELTNNPSQNISVMIGPEGGFEKSELEKIIGEGYIPCKLTENILRSETAAIVAAYEISSLS